MPRRDVALAVPIVDWRAVEHHACGRKRAYPARNDALAACLNLTRASRDDTLRVYPCPFAHWADGTGHFHIGHPPDLAGLRRIAAALRARHNDHR